MAVAYKGFELSIADAVTFETKQIIRKFEYTITDKVNYPSTGDNKTLEQCKESLLRVTADYEKVTGICYDDTAQERGYRLIQNVFPLMLKINIKPASGECLKIRADNNKFAISSSGLIWTLYNADLSRISGSYYFNITYTSGAGHCGFLAVTDFDGHDIVFGKSATYIDIEGRYSLGERYKIDSGSVYLSQDACDWLNSIGPIIQSTDPYFSGGTSEPGGGEGTFEDESDGIDFPSKPTISAVDTGFLTIYIPTLQELTSLSRYLWNSDATTIDFWKKLVADPMDLILGLNMLPFEIESSGSKSVVVGLIDTEIDMQYTTDQYVEIDCGSIHIDKFWDAYLDSDPYTRFELYLPYCGTHPIMADEVTGKDIAVKYLVDILSGSCVAFVKCGDNVLYQFAGNCAAQIPVTANQFSDMVRSAISVASAIGTMVATSGATAPMGLTSIASTATNSSALKPAVEKSGAVSGMSGQLAIQTPYLIITRPRQCIPMDQNKFIGYPSYVTMTLSDLTGFNVVSEIHIEGVPATSAELDELESIIKEGAIYG